MLPIWQDVLAGPGGGGFLDGQLDRPFPVVSEYDLGLLPPVDLGLAGQLEAQPLHRFTERGWQSQHLFQQHAVQCGAGRVLGELVERQEAVGTPGTEGRLGVRHGSRSAISPSHASSTSSSVQVSLKAAPAACDPIGAE